jgi:hypothetical protein
VAILSLPLRSNEVTGLYHLAVIGILGLSFKFSP